MGESNRLVAVGVLHVTMLGDVREKSADISDVSQSFGERSIGSPRRRGYANSIRLPSCA